MKGNPKIIAAMQNLLNCELAARDQYLLHSRMYEDMGLTKLYERISHESEEEGEHADYLIRRMLFLEGEPDVGKADPVKIGKTVPEMLQNDLDVEYYVADELKKTIKLCEQEQDYYTRDILMILLKDTEEDHAYWLEQQLRLIEKVGLENYLQSNMGDPAAHD